MPCMNENAYSYASQFIKLAYKGAAAESMKSAAKKINEEAKENLESGEA